MNGDLKDLNATFDTLRYEVTGKLLAPVDWSPIQEVDFESVPTEASAHETALYMEDTGWPTASLDDYVEYWDRQYYRFMREIPAEHQLLRIEACFQTTYGSHVRPEAILMQKVMDRRALGGLLSTTAVHDPETWPGFYMHGALELRDQWESKLLRAASWSPLS